MTIKDAFDIIASYKPCPHNEMIKTYLGNGLWIKECGSCNLQVAEDDLEHHHVLSAQFTQALELLRKIVAEVEILREERNSRQLNLFHPEYIINAP